MPNADLPPFEAFRAGTRTDMAGNRVTITAADLVACAAAYDQALQAAPIVIGHPATDHPAYGWVERMEVEGDTLRVVPRDVEAQFAQIVEDGRYSARSACFFRPDGRGNPKPGTWYLKHIGFLGAVPPAIPGLAPIAFAADADTVAFSYETRTIAGLFRRLREWLIAEKGAEAAEAVLPDYQLTALQEEAVRDDLAAARAAAAAIGFAAPSAADVTPQQPKEPPVTVNNDAELERLRAQLAARDAEVAAFAQQQRQARDADDAAFVDQLVIEARVPAGHRDEVVAFLRQQDDSATVAFASGDGAQPETPRAFLRRFLAAMPPTVSFGQQAAGGTVAFAADDPNAIMRAADEYQAAQRAKGVTVTDIEAVQAVTRRSA